MLPNWSAPCVAQRFDTATVETNTVSWWHAHKTNVWRTVWHTTAYSADLSKCHIRNYLSRWCINRRYTSWVVQFDLLGSYMSSLIGPSCRSWNYGKKCWTTLAFPVHPYMMQSDHFFLWLININKYLVTYIAFMTNYSSRTFLNNKTIVKFLCLLENFCDSCDYFWFLGSHCYWIRSIPRSLGGVGILRLLKLWCSGLRTALTRFSRITNSCWTMGRWGINVWRGHYDFVKLLVQFGWECTCCENRVVSNLYKL